MISEKYIDQVILTLNSAPLYEERLRNIIETRQALVSYLESEGFEILDYEERDLLWYLTVVVHDSILEAGNNIPDITVEDIEIAEEKNYAALESDHMKFSDMADLLFNDYPEEDLLAFIEDTVIPDEEHFPSPVGRKVIFISMKTVIDVLTGVN
ncbi:MAG: hypothetical protein HKN68_21815 [Saprospiraceae bacterium]|nr:hypothetical protein [Saprospiraceae bacterium]